MIDIARQPCPKCGEILRIEIDCHHEQDLAAKDKEISDLKFKLNQSMSWPKCEGHEIPEEANLIKEISKLKNEIRKLEHPDVHLSAKWFSNENEKLAKVIMEKNEEITRLREALKSLEWKEGSEIRNGEIVSAWFFCDHCGARKIDGVHTIGCENPAIKALAQAEKCE